MFVLPWADTCVYVCVAGVQFLPDGHVFGAATLWWLLLVVNRGVVVKRLKSLLLMVERSCGAGAVLRTSSLQTLAPNAVLYSQSHPARGSDASCVRLMSHSALHANRRQLSCVACSRTYKTCP